MKISDTILLLTATIDVNDCAFLQRNNISDRKYDYISALEKWLKNTEFKIVFIENSNYNLSFLQEKFTNYSERIEFLTFDGNNYDRRLGKGYGEVSSILYAIDNSSFLKESDYFIKSSGRYFLSNASDIIENLYIENYDLIAHRREWDSDIVPTIFYVCKKIAFKSFFKNNNIVDDSNFFYIEHLFKMFFDSLGNKSKSFSDELGLDGISGTSNEQITWFK